MYEDNANYQRLTFKKNLVISSKEDGNGQREIMTEIWLHIKV